MALKDQLSSDLAVFFNADDFAEEEEIIYITAEDQDEYVMDAIVDYLEDPGISGDGHKARYAEVILKKSALPAIRTQDTVSIDGDIWTVERHVESTEHVARVLVRREISHVVRGTA